MRELAKAMGVSLAHAREVERIVDEVYERNEKKRKAGRALARKKQPKPA